MNSTNGTLLNDAEPEGRGGADRRRHRPDRRHRVQVRGGLTSVLRVDDQAFRTDTGRQRSANEDSFFVRAPIFVVADGMGGAQAGEVASKAAADAFDRDLPDGAARAGSCARRSRRRTARSTSSPATTPRGPGWGRRSPPRSSTPQSEEVAIGHVGDSRAYRLRGGKLERLTRDHSLVEEMRRKGQITDAQAEDHPQRSIITRALGPEPEVEVDVQTVPAARRRRLPDLLGRPDDDDRRGADRPPARRRDLDDGGGAGAGRRGQPGRRPRQHHRARLPARRRRARPAAAAPRGRDPDRPHAPRRRA